MDAVRQRCCWQHHAMDSSLAAARAELAKELAEAEERLKNLRMAQWLVSEGRLSGLAHISPQDVAREVLEMDAHVQRLRAALAQHETAGYPPIGPAQ